MSERFRILTPVLVTACLSVIAFILVGAAFYARGKMIMEEQLKERLRGTAAAAAMQFDGSLLEQITSDSTMENSAALRDVVQRLDYIRNEVSHVIYAYIMEKTDDPSYHAFIADADLIHPFDVLDEDGDGTLNEYESPAQPGDLYDWSEFPVLGQEAFERPSVDEEIGEDQWGAIISGYAPIRNADGKVIATLGIDMAAEDYVTLSGSIFSPVALLLILLATVSIAGGTVLAFWKQRIDELERLETERMGLLRLAFHQLGGPLTIISWSIEELEDEGPASIQKTVENIHEGIRRLAVILKTLKDADMVHAGKIEYKPEQASLSAIVRAVAAESEAKLQKRKQRIHLSLDDSLTMKLDPKLIASVAQELVNNAIDFSPDGAEIRIVSERAGEEWAEFRVIDNGCGIPKKDQERIFHEFCRGSNAIHFKADGNGLGMYIVRGIVHRAGGKVMIRSTEGKGTTVTVRLPLDHA